MNFAVVQKEIEELVRRGELKSAQKKIETFIRKHKLTHEMRFHCSVWYSFLGEPVKALKILGPELDENALAAGDINLKRLQLRLAFMLSFFGAHNSSIKILNKVKKTFKANSNEMATLFRYSGNIYFRRYQFAEALLSLQASEKIAREQNTYHSYLSALVQIGQADCLDALNQSSKAIALVSEILTWEPKCHSNIENLVNLSLGEYYLRSLNLFMAESYLLKAEKDIQSDSKDKAFLFKWLGVLNYLKADVTKARYYYEKAQTIFSAVELNTGAFFELVFWRYLNDEITFSDPLFWPILLHPMDHPMGHILTDWFDYLSPKAQTNSFSSLGHSIPWKNFFHKVIPYSKKIAQMEINQIFRISEGQLSQEYYPDSILKGETVFLDLIAGQVLVDTHLLMPLTILEFKVLNNLARAGDYGVPIYMLIDLVYSEELSDPTSMYLRMEQLLNRLRKLSIEILRKENTLYLKPKGDILLNPKILKEPNILAKFSILYPSFTLEQASQYCNLSLAKLKNNLAQYIKSGDLVLESPIQYRWVKPLVL